MAEPSPDRRAQPHRPWLALPLGANTLFIGVALMFHVTDDLLSPRRHFDHFAPIGRLGSPSIYCRTADRFEPARITNDTSKRLG